MEFILVLTAHFLGDFIFQTNGLAKRKSGSIIYLFIHTFIYIIPLALVFIMFGDWWHVLIYIAAVFISHFLIDFIKQKLLKKYNTEYIALIIFIADILLHMLIVLSIAFWGFKSNNLYAWFYDTLLRPFDGDKLYYACLLMSFIICLKPASVLIKNILACIDYQMKKSVPENGGSLPEDTKSNNAGSLIGQLERVIIIILGAMGLYSLIGLVLTAKSIARFKQFEQQNFAEKYLIGTLCSLLIAAILLFILNKTAAVS